MTNTFERAELPVVTNSGATLMCIWGSGRRLHAGTDQKLLLEVGADRPVEETDERQLRLYSANAQRIFEFLFGDAEGAIDAFRVSDGVQVDV